MSGKKYLPRRKNAQRSKTKFNWINGRIKWKFGRRNIQIKTIRAKRKRRKKALNKRMRVQRWTSGRKSTKAKELSSLREKKKSHKKLEKERTKARAREKMTKRVEND